ncbi:MAG: hypothetical protein JXQ29_12490 [Planctomycetes bacterium]|nr:hypothetical protein [Planctomycetota bacterium]
MAHLWMEREAGEWAVAMLDSEAHVLDPNCDARLVRADERVADPVSGAPLPPAGVLLVRRAPDDEKCWALFCAFDDDVRVNGLPVAGVKALADRDEIRLPAGMRCYFSAERPARVEPLPAGDRVIHCGRCKAPIAPGSPALRCPECGVWHHQNEAIGRPCWTYGAVCGACPCPTAGAADYRWTPDGL